MVEPACLGGAGLVGTLTPARLQGLGEIGHRRPREGEGRLSRSSPVGRPLLAAAPSAPAPATAAGVFIRCWWPGHPTDQARLSLRGGGPLAGGLPKLSGCFNVTPGLRTTG